MEQEQPSFIDALSRRERIMVAVIGVLAIAFVTATVFAFTRGSSPSPTTTTGTAATSTTPPGSPSEGSPAATGPYTGGGLAAIKVDNAPGAAPIAGIGEARTLIEVPVEGGITRFIAVFGGGTQVVVGPVRSLRPVDVGLVPAFAPVLVSSGGRDSLIEELQGTGLQLIGPGHGALSDDPTRQPLHQVFADTSVVDFFFQGTEEAPGPLPLGEAISGDAASTIDIAFFADSPVHLEYRPDDGYLRFDGGAPLEVTASDGSSQPLHSAVVLVLEAAERDAGWADTNGVAVKDYDVVGSGRMYLASEGTLVEGTWSRASHDASYVLRTDSGAEAGVPEGSIYLAIVPRGASVSYR